MARKLKEHRDVWMIRRNGQWVSADSSDPVGPAEFDEREAAVLWMGRHLKPTDRIARVRVTIEEIESEVRGE